MFSAGIRNCFRSSVQYISSFEAYKDLSGSGAGACANCANNSPCNPRVAATPAAPANEDRNPRRSTIAILRAPTLRGFYSHQRIATTGSSSKACPLSLPGITVPSAKRQNAKREDEKMILRARPAAILGIPLMFLASHHSFAQDTTGTKRDVQKRLKAAQKPQSTAPLDLDNVIKTLFAAHTFQQAAISPDGNSVAWVEDIHSKNGAVSGSTVIYVKNLKSNAPRRIGAGVADS